MSKKISRGTFLKRLGIGMVTAPAVIMAAGKVVKRDDDQWQKDFDRVSKHVFDEKTDKKLFTPSKDWAERWNEALKAHKAEMEDLILRGDVDPEVIETPFGDMSIKRHPMLTSSAGVGCGSSSVHVGSIFSEASSRPAGIPSHLRTGQMYLELEDREYTWAELRAEYERMGLKEHFYKRYGKKAELDYYRPGNHWTPDALIRVKRGDMRGRRYVSRRPNMIIIDDFEDSKGQYHREALKKIIEEENIRE